MSVSWLFDWSSVCLPGLLLVNYPYFFFSLKSNPTDIDWKQCASIGFLTIPFEFPHYSCHDVNCIYYFFSLAWMHESLAAGSDPRRKNAVAPNKLDKRKSHNTAQLTLLMDLPT